MNERQLEVSTNLEQYALDTLFTLHPWIWWVKTSDNGWVGCRTAEDVNFFDTTCTYKRSERAPKFTKDSLKFRMKKIRVKSPVHSGIVQQAIFDVGGTWSDGNDDIEHESESFLYVDEMLNIRHGSKESVFQNHKYEEMTFPNEDERIKPEHIETFNNTKIRILSPEHSEAFQKAVIRSRGGFDPRHDSTFKYTDVPYIMVNGSSIMEYSYDRDRFDACDYREITFDLPPKEKCVWVQSSDRDGTWQGCGELMHWLGTPKYCPDCGKEVEARLARPLCELAGFEFPMPIDESYDLDEGWCELRLSDVITFVTDGKSQKRVPTLGTIRSGLVFRNMKDMARARKAILSALSVSILDANKKLSELK